LNEQVSYLRPKSIVETVVDYLRESIIANNFKSMEKINPNEVAEQLGVSSIPVREALRIIESEGLIVYQRGKGSRVSEVSRKDLEDTYDMRMVFEVSSIDLLKKKIGQDAKTLDMLKQIDLYEKADNFGPESCVMFHRRLIELTANRKLINHYDILLTNARRYQRMSYAMRHGGNCCAKLHAAILNPLIEGDYEKAKEAIKTHMHDTMEELLATVEFFE